MAPRKKTLAGTWRGPKVELFAGITWDPTNRAARESRYPDRPRFTAVELADWSRIYKRADIEHKNPGKNSFQALVGRKLVGSDFARRTAVYFVAYTKSHGIIEIISIRFCNEQERAIFFAKSRG